MNVLIIGSAGRVASVIRPALMAAHHCYHYDINPVPGIAPASQGGRGYVASIDDLYRLHAAMVGMDVVVNLAMGKRPGSVADVSDIDAVFNVHVCGMYRILLSAQHAGVRRVVTASSLSVYQNLECDGVFEESRPTDAWYPYAVSKRLGETVCDMAVQARPDMGIVSLRLMMPADEHTFANRGPVPYVDRRGREQHWCYMGPKDTARLFLAAIDYSANPGHHVFQATGEVEPRWYPCTKANELLGWRAMGE